MADRVPEQTDVLVVGSGIAGLVFALRMAEYGRVMVVTKKDRPESNTNYAQGGISAAVGTDDHPDLHAADTLAAGGGLCHPDAVRLLVRDGPGRVRDLMRWGVRFTREAGELSLGREGGHTRRRIVRAADRTGWEVERALLAAVAGSPMITMYDNHTVLELLISPGSRSGARRCAGAVVLAENGERPIAVRARATMLATGGCGQVYRHTTNPAIATGDGVALAYRAGAHIANMEFVQFHPTALYPAGSNAFLISEAVRGEGAELVRRGGTPFMDTYDPRGSLAPRDVVARAISREMDASGAAHALLDCTRIPADRIRRHFPNILRETTARGMDMLREPLPVVPAAHYMCGGILTDTYARSTMAGLLAAGEAACTGVHGANRLASNSLLEAVVFADRAAERLGSVLPRTVLREQSDAVPGSPARTATNPADSVRLQQAVRDLMWEKVGIVRNDRGLTDADERLEELRRRTGAVDDELPASVSDAEARNLLQIARLVVACARGRRESRGLHRNRDHPHRDNERFLRDTILVRSGGCS